MQDQIGAENPRDGAAGADGGREGARFHDHLGQAGGHATDKVENQKFRMTH